MTTPRTKPKLTTWQRTRDILLVATVLGSLLWFLGMWDWVTAETQTPVGTVQRIHFFSSFGLNTQIDTTERSFVVGGITAFRTGQSLVLHTGPFESELCTPDRRQCEFARGHPQ